MNQELLKTLATVLFPFAIGWAIWVTMSHMKAKNELDAFKLYVADNYIKKEHIDKVLEKLDHLSEMVNRIVGQLNASTKKE